MNKAVFLDRDGVINEICYHHEQGIYSAKSMEEFRLKQGVKESIKKIKSMGFLAVVFSNQPGVAFGYIKENDLEEINKYMKKEIGIDAVYNCTHHPNHTGDCNCRKPKDGMIIQASKDLGIEISRSYAVGDNLTDIQAGKGCKKTILIGPERIDIYHVMEKMKIFPDFIVKSLGEAVEKIEECENE